MLQGYGPSLLQGAVLTLGVAFASLLLALVLGLAGATARLSHSTFWRGAGTVYTTLIRGVPDLVLMLLVFFGGQIAVNALLQRFGMDYVDIDPFVAGVATLGFIFGAYFTETFRGAMLAIPHGQAEAARPPRWCSRSPCPACCRACRCRRGWAHAPRSGWSLRWPRPWRCGAPGPSSCEPGSRWSAAS